MWGLIDAVVASAPRQYYAATARVRCICVIIGSREIDERGEKEWGEAQRVVVVQPPRGSCSPLDLPHPRPARRLTPANPITHAKIFNGTVIYTQRA
jgi:hypothetical protein